MASQFPGGSPITPPPPPYAPPPAGGGLVGRVQRILTQPTTEWQRIAAEPSTAQGIFTGYAVPLAAIGPIAGLIGSQVFGYGAFGIRFHPPIVSSVITAVVQYVGALVGVWLLAFIIDLLAPTFGSTKDMNQSMKVAAYSLTPGWIAGIFGIIPMLGWLAIIGLVYGFYLFWVGLPIVKRPPADKAVSYAVVTIVADIVAYFVIGAIIAAITATFVMSTAGALTTPGAGSLTISGTNADGSTGSVDLGKLAVAGQQMAAAANTAAATNAAAGTTTTTVSNGKIVDPNALQAMLPASVAGFNRTTVESSGGAAGGLGAATAKGTYTQGDQSFELSVADVGALGNLATLGGALNVNSNKQTATGYEKSSMQNGNMVEEDWDNAAHHGKYSTMIASRFAVDAEGSAPSIDALKAAVGAIDMGRLASLAK